MRVWVFYLHLCLFFAICVQLQWMKSLKARIAIIKTLFELESYFESLLPDHFPIFGVQNMFGAKDCFFFNSKAPQGGGRINWNLRTILVGGHLYIWRPSGGPLLTYNHFKSILSFGKKEEKYDTQVCCMFSIWTTILNLVQFTHKMLDSNWIINHV